MSSAQCTIRNFPYLDIHTIEWAKEMFGDFFTTGPDCVNSLLENRDKFFEKMASSPIEEPKKLQLTKKWLQLSVNPTIDTCVKMAVEFFVEWYRDFICNLTTNYPEKSRSTDKDGNDLGPFWHGDKRFPKPAHLDIKEEAHLDFIEHATNILAAVFNFPEVAIENKKRKHLSREELKQRVAKIKIDPYVHKGKAVDMSGARGEEKKEEKKEVSADDKAIVQAVRDEFKKLDLSKYKRLSPTDFEKDDDSNHHIAWITAAAGMRCFNYDIKAPSRQHCRMVAGRIIPAIATTTAMITGFVQIEIFKYVKGLALEAHRQVTCNLAVNVFSLELLPDPKQSRSRKVLLDAKTKYYQDINCYPNPFTVWDKIVINAPNATLKEFEAAFQKATDGRSFTLLGFKDKSGLKVMYMATDFTTKANSSSSSATSN